MPDPRIQLLDDHVCNKIAAGEVIERPASVVKELVENALDAGASEIEIEVLQGGRKAVIIRDNGHGMSRENALLAIERHATSKIRDVDDIEQIHTMGFRGEALAAIAAVSRFRIVTRRTEDLAGTEVLVESGVLKDVRETGCPPGTTLEVRNLFLNVPARRKFLRTEATELANIRGMFKVFCLGHPEVGFRLKVDGRELEHHVPQPRLSDRIAELYGDGVLRRLLPVETALGDLRITGYTSRPDLHRNDRSDQVILINRRAATAPIIAYAIREAYRDSLPKDRHALVFLHLEMPPDWVDVNVHPTKREVRFRPSQQIRDALVAALETALFGPPAALTLDDPPPTPEPEPPRLAPAARQPELPSSPPPPAASAPAPPYPPLPPIPPLPPRPAAAPTPPLPPPPPPPPAREPVEGPWQEVSLLGRTGNRFVLLETESGLVILDPPAARERILFEQALAEFARGQGASQALLLPESITLSADQAETLRERLDHARKLGFVLEAFGENTFLIEALPAWMSHLAPDRALEPLISDLESGALRPDTPAVIRETLAKSCCRIAAASQESSRPEALLALVHQLAKCRMPYTTPFGRPTMIHMGFRELRRKFGLES